MLCLRAHSLALDRPGAGAIAGQVVDAVYRCATTSVEVRTDADAHVVLRLDIAGEPPQVDARVHLEVRDGWRIPGTAP